MNADIADRLAAAIGPIPGVAYLSPNPRALLNGLARGAGPGRGGIQVHRGSGGWSVEIRLAVHRGAPVLTTARAVRETTERTLTEYEGHPPQVARITVTVTAIV